MKLVHSTLAAGLAIGIAGRPSLALDACLFQPLHREIGFEGRIPETLLNDMTSAHYGWGTVRFATSGTQIVPPMYYLADAGVRPATDSSVRLLISGTHIAGPVLPDFFVTVIFPRPVTEASFSFGAPLLSRREIAARVAPLDADGNAIGGEFIATTNQSAGNYPGGGGPPVPITREGTATVSGLTFSGMRISFEPIGGFAPGFEDPTTETPRDFRLDNVRWTPVPYCCPADFDGDGSQSVGDIFTYLDGWFRNDRMADPRIDFNLSGLIDLGDLFAFLNAWFTGCP